MNHLPPRSKILELGPGIGHIARLARRRDGRWLGLEASLDCIGDLRRVLSGGAIVDLESLDRLPAWGDALLAADTLEHLSDPQRMLQAIHQALPPGGRLLLSVPNVANVYVRLSLLAGRFPYADRGILDRTHKFFFTRRSVTEMVTAAGFEIEGEAVSSIPLPLLWPRLPPRVLAVLCTLLAGLTRLLPTLLGYQILLHARRAQEPPAAAPGRRDLDHDEAATGGSEPPPAAVAPARPRGRVGALTIGALLFLATLGLYLGNRKTVPFDLGGDSIPNRLIPFSILHYGTITMDPFRQPFASRGGYRWYVQERRDRLVSYYPIGTPLVALPVYVPIYAWLVANGWSSADELFSFSEPAEKLAASLLTALTVLLVWQALRWRTSFARATWTAVALASCSLLWPVASQVLWSHTAGALLLALVLLLARPGGISRPFLAGLAMGLCFVVRPQTAPFVAGVAAGLFFAAPRGRPLSQRALPLIWYGLGCLVMAVPNLLYTRHYYDNWFGGYSSATGLFSGAHLLEGMSGLLFSPNRGLFVLMPVALVGVVGAWRLLRRPGADPVLSGLTVGAFLYFVVHAATETWAGGWCFGPRYLTETMPILAVTSTLVLTRPSRALRGLVALAVLWSFTMQLSGAWFYPASNWNPRMGPNLERAAWDGSHFMPLEDYRAWRLQAGAD